MGQTSCLMETLRFSNGIISNLGSINHSTPSFTRYSTQNSGSKHSNLLCNTSITSFLQQQLKWCHSSNFNNVWYSHHMKVEGHHKTQAVPDGDRFRQRGKQKRVHQFRKIVICLSEHVIEDLSSLIKRWEIRGDRQLK